MDLPKSRPGPAPKSLSYRTARAEQMVGVAIATLPARLIEDCRAEAAALHARARRLIGDDAAPVADVAALVRACVAVRAQLADLLGVATRPRGESPRRRPIDAPGIPTDALEIAPPAPPDASTTEAAPVTH